ncbi:MAG: response regulator [Timaviella obliquedivisa GSE-PSE-MK23-08B]|jgi:diguanylate cyclase (GGDEF)-like protein|nr:response regulator [Timaviella obliquedivisa GSE-PSE-MK23-08B]
MKILVVEDDELIAQALRIILSDQNYAVELAQDGQVGLELIEIFDYDLLLLDVMLPRLDGISLCRQVRSQGHQMPILLLTGRDSKHEKATGLDAGADDYVVKPFDTEELVARVRALLRRANSSTQPLLEWGGLQLDPSSCEVIYQDKLLSVTPKEYALLELFLRNNRRVFSCDAILEHLWTYEDMPGEEAVRTHIKGLRQKLKTVGAPATLIETVYGIGYRLKPLNVKHVPAKLKEKPNPSDNQPIPPQAIQSQSLAIVAGIWHRFQAKVSAQVEVLEKAAAAALVQSLDPQLHQQAKQDAHTLAGSLSMFGFPHGGDLARNIEQLLGSPDALSPDQVQKFQAWVMGLRQDIEQPIEEKTPEFAVANTHPLLLIADRDRLLAEALAHEAEKQGFRGMIAPDLAIAQSILDQHQPDIVLLDLEISSNSQESLALLSKFQRRMPPIPVLVFANQASLTQRVEVARHGGRFFLQKPFSLTQVFEAVNQVLKRAEPAQTKIMVVDDDPEIVPVLKTLLEPWGLKVTMLQDPEQFWETLETCSPDLLILDVEMPYLGGIELCQVVRNDIRWGGLPILFLTAHTEFSIIDQVFAAGADDFVSKPIVGSELVARIITRLERLRLMRRIAETDPLTGVANRQKSTQDLEELLSLADRHQQTLSFAILDLDHFKQINDRYGHAAGDTVLRQVGYLLQQSFQSEDVIARWGGEEFVVGMYGMVAEEAVQRLVILCQMLEHQPFYSAEDQFQVSLSAGVAQYPQDGSDLRSLYRSADVALQQAKKKQHLTDFAIATYR